MQFYYQIIPHCLWEQRGMGHTLVIFLEQWAMLLATSAILYFSLLFRKTHSHTHPHLQLSEGN